MNTRTTLILFGVLVASIGVFLILQVWDVQTPEERLTKARRLLPSLADLVQKPASQDPQARLGPATVKTDEFTRIVVEHKGEAGQPGERFEFRRVVGNPWRMIAPRNVRTNQQAVETIITQLVRAEADVTEGDGSLAGELSSFGLDAPAVSVALYRGEHALTASLSRPSAHRRPLVYATSPDRQNKPIMLQRYQVDQLFAALDDFRARELFPSAREVTGIRLKPDDGPEIALKRGSGTAWSFADAKLGEADRFAADQLANTLAQLRDQSYVAPAANPSHGLAGGKARLVATVEYQVDEKGPARSEQVLIGAADLAPPAEAGAVESAAGFAPLAAPFSAALALANAKADPDHGHYFARSASETYVVRVDARQVRGLFKKPDDLRNRHLFPDVVGDNLPTVDAIHLTSGGEQLRFYQPTLQAGGRPAPADWILFTDKAGKHKTYLNTVPELLVNLKELTTRAVLDDDSRMKAFGVQASEFGFDKPQAELTIWQNAVDRTQETKPDAKEEPKLKADAKEKPAVRLTFGRSETRWWRPRVVYVRKQVGDGPALVVAVPDPFTTLRRRTITIADQVTGGYLAFRDRTLPSFTYQVQGPFVTTTATKITYRHRHGLPYEVVKEERAGSETWRLLKPVEGEAKADNIKLILLDGLARKLTAAKLLTDAATDQDRADPKYGFNKPLLRITVTAQDKHKKPDEYTYVFGNHTGGEGPNAEHYYARMEVEPGDGTPPSANRFIFLVPEATLKKIDMELRADHIFPDESGLNPTDATFTWRKLDKDKKLVESTMHLVLKDWTAETDPPWRVQSLIIAGRDATAEAPKLDDLKLKDFLGPKGAGRFTRLNHLATGRYMVHKGKPEPRHRLDPASKDAPPSLVIEVKYSNAQPRTLILGERWEQPPEEYPGLSGEKAYYFATASHQSDTVFLMAESEFETMIAGYEHFKAGVGPEK